nr:MAG: hypothetical protein TU35_03675 [Thermoproteus sp. AZ2]
MYAVLENDLLKVVVHLPSSSVIEIYDKANGASHLLAREPELAAGLPGMGIYEAEPDVRPLRYEEKNNSIIFQGNKMIYIMKNNYSKRK